MRFYADLHLHSRFAYATSRYATLTEIAYWACRKGLRVIATGDFTHPAWMAELKQSLEPAEQGLYRLNDTARKELSARLSASCPADLRFMLCVEVSTVYPFKNKQRKLHHLLYVPDFAAADRLTQVLLRYGRLDEDGRPTLSLPPRDLLAHTLSSGEDAFLIPAHIWTPWFGMLGSKTGFDSLDECYGNLSHHIFAAETGLSSDPLMNRRVPFLDKLRMVSFSDAHSPQKLAREATLFDTELSFSHIKRAMETGQGFKGTVEFFPEEGKYHLDGHRKCNIRLTPEETRKLSRRCPVCGKKLTVGVLHRVEDLSRRGEAEAAVLAKNVETTHLIPLIELIAEIKGVSPESKKVNRAYDEWLTALGPELRILTETPLSDIRQTSAPLAEAIARVRRGEVWQ